jgi:sugar lactone lactonase YvrE
VDIAYSSAGELYLSELHGARVLRVGADGLIETYVGSAESPGYPGFSGDGGPALGAEMSESFGIALADDGTLFIADTGNARVRIVSPDGIIDTLAGGPKPGFADGVGEAAQLNSPRGLHYDAGYLYVADTNNHAVRRIDVQSGEVVTVAGTGVGGFGGDGGPAAAAQLSAPVGVSVGPDGAIYIADSGNHVLRRVDLDGVITTIAGQPGVNGFAGDGLALDQALLDWPNDVLISDAGDLYVVDTLNSRLRMVRSYLP